MEWMGCKYRAGSPWWANFVLALMGGIGTHLAVPDASTVVGNVSAGFHECSETLMLVSCGANYTSRSRRSLRHPRRRPGVWSTVARSALRPSASDCGVLP